MNRFFVEYPDQYGNIGYFSNVDEQGYVLPPVIEMEVRGDTGVIINPPEVARLWPNVLLHPFLEVSGPTGHYTRAEIAKRIQTSGQTMPKGYQRWVDISENPTEPFTPIINPDDAIFRGEGE
jgi:hypothetical protein